MTLHTLIRRKMLRKVLALCTADLVHEVVVNKDIIDVRSTPDGGKLKVSDYGSLIVTEGKRNRSLNRKLKRK